MYGLGGDRTSGGGVPPNARRFGVATEEIGMVRKDSPRMIVTSGKRSPLARRYRYSCTKGCFSYLGFTASRLQTPLPPKTSPRR